MKPFYTISATIHIQARKFYQWLPRIGPMTNHKSLCRVYAYVARLALIVSCVFVRPNDGHGIAVGTVIFVVATHNEIAIAADSRTSYPFNPTRCFTTTCKIQQSGQIFFAIAGITKDEDGTFDAYAIARRICAGSGSIQTKADQFQREVREPLASIIKQLKDASPTYYHKRIKNTISAFESVFVAFENGRPKVHNRTFLVTGEVDVLLTPQKTDPELSNYPITAPMGEFAEAIAGGMIWITDRTDLPELARMYVRRVIDSGNPWVGDPIDILSITNRGARWVKKNPECPEIEPYTEPEQHKKPTSAQESK